MEQNKQTLLNDDEMQSIAGGLSEDAKKKLMIGGVVVGGLAAGATTYKFCDACVKQSRRMAEVELQQGVGACNLHASIPFRSADIPRLT